MNVLSQYKSKIISFRIIAEPDWTGEDYFGEVRFDYVRHVVSFRAVAVEDGVHSLERDNRDPFNLEN